MRSIFIIMLAAMLFLPAPVLSGQDSLNISYVKSPYNLQLIVMKRLKLLEKELEAQGVGVNWHEINSGARQARAMASGDLDIGGVMNTTSIQMAQGEGNPVQIAAGVSRPTGLFAIVGQKNGPASIKELKGKKIAGPKGTVLHQLLAAALAREGMGMDDVEFIQMDPPKAFSALESGQVDAALLAAGLMLKAEEAGQKVLATAEGLVVPKLVVAASGKFAAEHPERLQAVLRAHDKAAAWIAANMDEALAMGAQEEGIDLASARKLYEGSHFIQRLEEEDLASMEDDLKFMLDNGMMRSPIDPKAMVLPQAMEK